MADNAPAEAPAKLSLADVLHRLVDLVSLHPDTAAQAHQLVADNVATDEEKEAKEAAANVWRDRSDDDVADAAIKGDQQAAAEWGRRKNAPPPSSPA